MIGSTAASGGTCVVTGIPLSEAQAVALARMVKALADPVRLRLRSAPNPSPISISSTVPSAPVPQQMAVVPVMTVMKRGELRGKISTKPGLNRYLRVTPGGLLHVDKAKIKTEANLDGKYLLRCSDPRLPAADIALGYKQLLEVERGWRDMKQIIDLRPVYHRLEQRIRAHVMLCWLALLLIRIIETTTGQAWHTCAATSTGSTPSPSPAHRDLPPAHRPHQAADRSLRPPRPSPPQEDHRDQRRRALTRHNAAA